jgi:hypothetical protein
MICTLLLSALAATAGTTENFNSRKGVPIQNIRTSLQSSCWTFHHFDINHNGWNPKLEGDGAMVSDQTAMLAGNSGIFTPILNVASSIKISFDYTFSENFSAESSRWMKIGLANSENEIIQMLDVIDFNGANATRPKKYNTVLRNIIPGDYRLVLLYGGSGGSARIAVDELNTSAPFKYEGGCNTAPVALKDKITGLYNRTASGTLLNNDKDRNNESLKAFLIKDSPDGKVELEEDGSFVFTPDKDFTGNFTSFIYRICDNGSINLCSPNTSVSINFPPVTIAGNQLVDFKGSYKNNGNVELAWNTKPGNNLDKFEVERSIDGRSWQNSGTIPAKNESDNVHDYTYTDKVNKNTALKKDLYYRLKQVKTDGSISTSRLLIVRVYNTRTVTMISVTPNPVKSDIAVNVQLQESSYVSMRIFNNSGTSVLHKITEAERGINNLVIDGSSKLKPGMYMLEVIVNSKERMLVKLIKE